MKRLLLVALLSLGCGGGGSDETLVVDPAPLPTNSTSNTTVSTEASCVFYIPPDGSAPINEGENTPAVLNAALIKSATQGGDVTVNSCNGDVIVNVNPTDNHPSTTIDTDTNSNNTNSSSGG